MNAHCHPISFAIHGTVSGATSAPTLEPELNIPVAKVFRPLLGKARYKGAYGGRASAKSHFFADQVIIKSLGEKCDIICLRETQLSLQQSVKKLIEEKIETFGLGKYFTVLETHIESQHGGRIGFQGMQNHTAESIKSLQGYKYAFIEEAQNLSQRSYSPVTT